jgi:hypothetical protein
MLAVQSALLQLARICFKMVRCDPLILKKYFRPHIYRKKGEKSPLLLYFITFEMQAAMCYVGKTCTHMEFKNQLSAIF